MGVSILVFVSLLSGSTPTLYGRNKTVKEALVTLAGDYVSGKFKLNVYVGSLV